MSETKRSLGCLGFILVALFLGAFVLVIFRMTEADLLRDEHMARSARGEGIGPEFTTMDAQLQQAYDQKRQVTLIHLEGALAPLVGQWSVKELGYDVVVLDGPSGVLTLRIEAIVGVQVEPAKEAAPPFPSTEALKVEPQLEK